MADSKLMVLRSVHLPPEMDDQLRGLAFNLRCSKADLIRHFVGNGLAAMVNRLGQKPLEKTREQIVNEIQSGGGGDAAQIGLKEDIRRFAASAG